MKTALVTGATSGIGQAVAIALATAGYQVYAIGRSEAALNALRAAKSGIVPIALDLTDREAVEAALSDLQIDVLVNNADIMPPLGTSSGRDWNAGSRSFSGSRLSRRLQDAVEMGRRDRRRGPDS
ncbi:MAG: SDR family NAD(P)-dependent oxidoreductase [Hyphomicrobiales bacterium]|nr:SDR family NAD(P)-dependent oxidoreductase [Hyphomicrobiales bacterium]